MRLHMPGSVSSVYGKLKRLVTYPGRLLATRRNRMFAAITVGALIVGAITPIVVNRFIGLPDDAAFRVGGEVVTKEQLNDRIEVLEALYGIQRPAQGPQADKFRRDSAKAVAISMVLKDAAHDRGIQVSDKAARDRLTDMIESRMGEGGRQAFIQVLSNAGASERDVIEEIKLQIVSTRLADDVTRGLPKVTDEDVREAFRRRRAEFRDPEKRQLRNIVVESKDRARHILGRAKSGVEFADLVQQYSIDQSTRGKRGDLGFVARDKLERAYADAAFSTSAGSFFGPVRTRHGWNVGQVVEVRPGQPLKFEEVRQDLRRTLVIKREMQAWRDWVGSQLREVDVVYADEYQPANPYTLGKQSPIDRSPGADSEGRRRPG